MPPRRAPSAAARYSINKYGFRVPTKKASAQAKPRIPRAVKSSPKRPREAEGTTNASQAHAKRARSDVTIDTSRPSPIVISDHNEDDVIETRTPKVLQPRPVKGISARADILDLTIESPPSDTSSERATSPVAETASDCLPQALLEAEIDTRESEVRCMYAFKKSRVEPFAAAVKAEVEDRSPMTQRLRSITLEDDRTVEDQSSQFKTPGDDRGGTPRLIQDLRLIATVVDTDSGSQEESLEKPTEGLKRDFTQRCGLIGAPVAAPFAGKVIFKETPARPGQLATVNMLTTDSDYASSDVSQSSAAARATSSIAYPFPYLQPMSSTEVRQTHGPSRANQGSSRDRVQDRRRVMGGADMLVAAQSRTLSSRIPVPTGAQNLSLVSKGNTKTTSTAALPPKNSALADQSSDLDPGYAQSRRGGSLDYRERTVDSDGCHVIDPYDDSSEEYRRIKKVTGASKKDSAPARERHKTPVNRIMPCNTLTPIRAANFDERVNRAAERKNSGLYGNAKIFPQPIRVPNVKQDRLELFWLTLMKIVDAKKLFQTNYETSSRCIHFVNKVLGEGGSFSEEEGDNVISELQHQRMLWITGGSKSRLFFSRDAQDTMGGWRPR